MFKDAVKVSSSKFLFPFKGSDSSISSPYEVKFPKGKYFVQLFGGSGGGSFGGTGGVTTGFLKLSSDKTLFLYVGGKGKSESKNGCINGGWNGGGNACSEAHQNSGGGAIDIRLSKNTQYNDRILIAGGDGGQGSSYYNEEKFHGGYGGTEVGETSFSESGKIRISYGGLYSKGGSQTRGGTGVIKKYTYTNENGKWGVGGKCAGGYASCGAGGGGYYGGAGGYDVTGGGGGSSYYNSQYISNALLLTGNIGNGKIYITVIRLFTCHRKRQTNFLQYTIIFLMLTY